MALKDLVSRPERSPERTGPAAGPEAPPSPAATPPERASPPRGGATTTFLDASTVFEGVVHGRESLRLDGRVKGEIRCDHDVVIGESAHLEADIRAVAVVVAGEVHGHIQASRKITLGATARVVGDLTTPGIVIEEGATVQGRIQIGPKMADAEEAKQEVAPQPEAAREAKAAAPTAPPPGPPPGA